MVEKGNTRIEIDLNQFKLHIRIEDRMMLSLHFNSPSRRFYLSVIALVVTEMKRLGKLASIPLEGHYQTLALLNETIGGQAGSSGREHLLPRVYRKWMDALPDLDHAPLFRVLGRTKEYEELVGKTYPFTDEEKDAWANLFEYRGSHENVRLRFSVDRLGATLDDVVITYGEMPGTSGKGAWERFLESLTQGADEHYVTVKGAGVSPWRSWAWWHPWRRSALYGALGVILAAVIVSTWYFFIHPSKSNLEAVFKGTSLPPLPDKPSIAVLPFTNLSAEPEQEYFCDGITDEIITSLSKVPRLLVIARNSTFTYKGQPVKVQKVAEDLGVRYVLEGSIQRSGQRIRVTTQLVDAITGHHVWAERYDRELKNIFAVQDEITLKIITALQVQLTEGEQARVYGSGTMNLQAYLKVLQATEYGWRLNPEDNRKARQLCKEAVALDPNYAIAYRMLAATHMMEVWLESTKSPRDSLRRAAELSKKAFALDESLAHTHTLLGHIYLLHRDYEKGIAEGQRAVELEPNGADAHWFLGAALNLAGSPEQAIPVSKKAIRLNPFAPGHYFHCLAMAYRDIGRYEEAIEWGEKAVERSPESVLSHRVLITCYSLAGRMEEARAQVADLLGISSKYCVGRGKERYKDRAVNERLWDALSKAGLPECPVH